MAPSELLSCSTARIGEEEEEEKEVGEATLSRIKHIKTKSCKKKNEIPAIIRSYKIFVIQYSPTITDTVFCFLLRYELIPIKTPIKEITKAESWCTYAITSTTNSSSISELLLSVNNYYYQLRPNKSHHGYTLQYCTPYLHFVWLTMCNRMATPPPSQNSNTTSECADG